MRRKKPPWNKFRPDHFAEDYGLWLSRELSAEAKPRQRHKATLAAALKQAKEAGVNVSGATLAADGSVSLQFGEPEAEQTNELDKWMAKHHAN